MKVSKGFAILYAVLVSSILLSIGLAIFNITIKELLFSSLGRESQFAFYAADTGVECALYWNFENDSFSTSTPLSPIRCGGFDNPMTLDDDTTNGVYTRTFRIDFTTQPYCTEVTVTKFENPVSTKIEARGYNTCDVSNPRRVERAIRVTY